jgi:hypothetical protein
MRSTGLRFLRRLQRWTAPPAPAFEHIVVDLYNACETEVIGLSLLLYQRISIRVEEQQDEQA